MEAEGTLLPGVRALVVTSTSGFARKEEGRSLSSNPQKEPRGVIT